MFARLSLLNDGEKERIHQKSLAVLEKIGVIIGSEEIRLLVAAKGAKVTGENVRFPQKMVEEMLSLVTAEFPLGATTPSYRLTAPFTSYPYSTTAGYVPYIFDEERQKKRYATTEDLQQLCVVAHNAPDMDVFWPMVLPGEYRGELQEFKAAEIAMRHIGKHIQCSSVTKDMANYQVELAKTITGGSKELWRNPILSLLAAPTTPLAIEHGVSEAIAVAAKNGLPLLPMSLPQMTTTSPATMASNLLLANCEVLACYLVAKCAHEDARVFYSTDAGVPSLLDGSIDYDNPEYPILHAGNADMGRFYKMPSAIGSSVETKDFTTLAGFDRNVFRLAMLLMAGADVNCWLGTRDKCLCGSLVDVLLDLEVLRYAKAFCRRFNVDEASLAYDILAEQGPRGNFLDHEHTFMNFRKDIFTEKTAQSYLFQDGHENYRAAAKARLAEILATKAGLTFDDDMNRELDAIAKRAERELKN